MAVVVIVVTNPQTHEYTDRGDCNTLRYCAQCNNMETQLTHLICDIERHNGHLRKT